MAKTTRVLEMLEALQDHPGLTGPQLAERLGVDVRTIRRYTATLGELGIPVDGEPGPGGGYRLGPGFRTPPLMLTDEETTSVVLGLLAARRDGVDTGGALAKVRRVLPDQVRLRVEAFEEAAGFTAPAPPGAAAPVGDVLLRLAEAIRRGRRVRVRYTTHEGDESQRELSPHGLVAHAGRWYLAAYDHGREALRTLRADRVRSIRLAGPGMTPPPDFDPVAFVSHALARVPWAHDAEVVVHAPLARAAEHFPPTLAELTVLSAERTRVRIRADSLDWVAQLLAGSGLEFRVTGPDGLRDAVRRLAARLRSGARGADRSRATTAR